MSDELFDWGNAGPPADIFEFVPDAPPETPPAQTPTEIRIAKRTETFYKLIKTIKEDADNGTYTHIWFGQLPGDKLKEAKRLTMSKKITKDRIYPVKGIMGWDKGSGRITPSGLKMMSDYFDYAYLLLNDEEAMNIKLIYSGEKVLIKDKVSAFWMLLSLAALTERYKITDSISKKAQTTTRGLLNSIVTNHLAAVKA